MDPNSLNLDKPFLLNGFVQTYAWGMDNKSLVAQLSGQESDNGKFAELWFGDHVNGPARIVGQDMDLRTAIRSSPELILGNAVIEQYGNTLPFLFKILSVGSALSIQTHPDEHFAKELHQRSPEQYKDPFPKPEVGIALSEVELLYGFRARSEILSFLQSVPEFKYLISESTLTSLQNEMSDDEKFYQTLYSEVMNVQESLIVNASKELYGRLTNCTKLSPEEAWILELQKTYPAGDVGLFSFFMLNLVTVPPGSALFIGPNIPHAYLRNELAECMAPSDNVVRAGLTPKFIDRSTLIEMLHYEAQPPELLQPQPVAGQGTGYGELPTPNGRYFKVGIIQASHTIETFRTNNSVEMVVAVGGELSLSSGGINFKAKRGQAMLIPASCQQYSLSSDGIVFRIFTPSN